MLCNRSSTTKLLRNLGTTLCFRRPRTINSVAFEITILPYSTSNLLLRRSFVSLVTRRTYHALNILPANDTSISHSEDAVPEKHRALTTEQISRLASRAVRLAIQRNQLKEAHTIIQSLSQSIASYSSELQDITVLRRPAIDFGVPVSPRLASHCLLHGLIRLGHLKQADITARQMWQIGLKIRSKSLEAIVHGLAHHAIHHDTILTDSHSTSKSTSSTIVEPESLLGASHHVRDEYLSKAMELVDAAGKYNGQRTRKMFSSLIDACLLQGEIIVAAFLFSFLVKQFLIRRKRAQAMDLEQSKPNNSPVMHEEQSQAAPLLRKSQPHFTHPFPELPFMNKILSYSDATLFMQREQGSGDERSISEAMQAIADLAFLLDDGIMPFNHVSSLVRALYNCLNGPKIKILAKDIDGSYRSVFAHHYFDDVLYRLVWRLPTHKPAITDHRCLKPLDRRSYNSLVYYAFRHRVSPALASMILEHMTKFRQPPLQPDITTFNILLRAGTLLRRDDIVALALSGLRRNSDLIPKPSEPDTPYLDSGSNVEKQRARYKREEEKPHHLISRVSTENFNLQLSQVDHKGGIGQFKADDFTLSAYISLLVARGNPEAVENLLLQLIPELSGDINPTGDPSSQTKWDSANRDDVKQAVLIRAIEYGPRFFVTVLNALAKAGKTGLAERIWTLAKQAEAASWDENIAEQGGAWCLPIHAYTIMMQLYASEGRKGLKMRRIQRVGSMAQIVLHRGTRPPDKDYAVGWTRQIHGQENETFGRIRADVARDRAILLYHSMQWDAEQIYDSLMTLQDSQWIALKHKGLQVPRPDERFFNAALHLFGRQSGMFKRDSTSTMSYWRQKIRWVHRRYASHRILPPKADARLLEILQAMHDAGYPIPIAYRQYLVGVWFSPPSEVKVALDRKGSSHQHDLTEQTNPYYLVTKKTRGLPIPKGRRSRPPIRRRTIRRRTK